MYGMVNKAIEGLVCRDYGIDKWELIKKGAHVSDEIFIGNQHYDDQITYSLVSAASRELEISGESLLFSFGEYWVLEIAGKGYPALMDAAGTDLIGFFQHLPNFHKRVQFLLPDLKPPRFQVDLRSDHSLILHYTSHRSGLKPFVEGLISGLGRRFGKSVKSRCIYDRSESEETRLGFLIRWRA
jgi:hypothetical protein